MTDWRDLRHPECGTDVFFDWSGGNKHKAYAICKACPAYLPCRTWCMDPATKPILGIVAATTPGQRNTNKRKSRAVGRVKNCLVCDTQFTSTIKNKKLCSDECKEMRYFSNRAASADRVRPALNPAAHVKCGECGHVLMAASRRHRCRVAV